MLMPGPRITATSLTADSTPSAAPTRSAGSGSKLEPSPTAGGKQVAGTLSARPGWSLLAACLRSTCGPSVIITEGTPSRSTPLVVQKSAPLVSAAFSSRVRSAAVTSVDGSGWAIKGSFGSTDSDATSPASLREIVDAPKLAPGAVARIGDGSDWAPRPAQPLPVVVVGNRNRPHYPPDAFSSATSARSSDAPRPERRVRSRPRSTSSASTRAIVSPIGRTPRPPPGTRRCFRSRSRPRHPATTAAATAPHQYRTSCSNSHTSRPAPGVRQAQRPPPCEPTRRRRAGSRPPRSPPPSLRFGRPPR